MIFRTNQVKMLYTPNANDIQSIFVFGSTARSKLASKERVYPMMKLFLTPNQYQRSFK